MSGIDAFLASSEDQQAILDAFQSHNFSLNFRDPAPSYLADVPTGSGVYFIAGIGNGFLKAYVGKANSLRIRIGDYHRRFQVHCPTDRKLAFFQDWLIREHGDWRLQLFTLPTVPQEISSVEAVWISRLHPLVNATVRADLGSRDAVEYAFRQFFESFFHGRLR